MRPNFTIILLPVCQNQARLADGAEQRLVQALIAQLAVASLDKGVLLRFARREVMPTDTTVLRPDQHRAADQLRPIVDAIEDLK